MDISTSLRPGLRSLPYPSACSSTKRNLHLTLPSSQSVHAPIKLAVAASSSLLNSRHLRKPYSPALHGGLWRSLSGTNRSGFAITAALPGPLDNIFTLSTTGVSVLAIIATLSFRPGVEKGQPGKVSKQEDSFEWGLVGFVSCIPIFNFVAWVLPALDISSPYDKEDSSKSLYYAYTILYAAPLLRNGFDFDGYSFLMLALCIAHVQVERIAATEPEQLDALKPLTSASLLLRQSIGSAVRFGSSVQKAVEERVAVPVSQLEAGRKSGRTSVPQEGEEDPKRSIDRLELESFDRQLRLRESQKRMEKQMENEQRTD